MFHLKILSEQDIDFVTSLISLRADFHLKTPTLFASSKVDSKDKLKAFAPVQYTSSSLIGKIEASPQGG